MTGTSLTNFGPSSEAAAEQRGDAATEHRQSYCEVSGPRYPAAWIKLLTEDAVKEALREEREWVR